MSELISPRMPCSNFRWQLLATVSTFALLTASLAPAVRAESTDQPTVWIDLGAQAERLGNSREIYDPTFLDKFDGLDFQPVLPVQRPARYSIGGEGKISFEPTGSDWIFSAGIRYGRSARSESRYQQIPQSNPQLQTIPFHLNSAATYKESHAILDFQVGRDIGLGMFKGSSTFSLGVRFAQFESRSTANLSGVPDFYSHALLPLGYLVTHHRYYATANDVRSFHGVGPSLAWQSSTPVSGNSDEGISMDYGINAAVLFGRQKVLGNGNTVGLHYKTKVSLSKYHGVASSYHRPQKIVRTHSVVIPNIGGFAGLSWRYADAKVKFGYRADFFFNAMDGGLGTRRSYNQSFYGPFATISIGLGR